MKREHRSDFNGQPSLFGLGADAAGNLYVSVAGYAWKPGAQGQPADIKIMKLAAGTWAKSVFGTLPYNGSYLAGSVVSGTSFTDEAVTTKLYFAAIAVAHGHIYVPLMSQDPSCRNCMLCSSLAVWEPILLPKTWTVSNANDFVVVAAGDDIIAPLSQHFPVMCATGGSN